MQRMRPAKVNEGHFFLFVMLFYPMFFLHIDTSNKMSYIIQIHRNISYTIEYIHHKTPYEWFIEVFKVTYTVQLLLHIQTQNGLVKPIQEGFIILCFLRLSFIYFEFGMSMEPWKTMENI